MGFRSIIIFMKLYTKTMVGGGLQREKKKVLIQKHQQQLTFKDLAMAATSVAALSFWADSVSFTVS